jgi:hypothetical protein
MQLSTPDLHVMSLGKQFGTEHFHKNLLSESEFHGNRPAKAVLPFGSYIGFSLFFPPSLPDCGKIKKKITLQAWTGPEGSRRLRLPDFKTIGT